MLTRAGRRAGAGVTVAAGVVALFCCALQEARGLAPQSDGASNVLQAWAMLHGNPLLRGWHLSDVSFYTTELPEYAIVELVRGMRPSVVQLSSALTYTLLVILAALVARGRAEGREGLIRAAVPVVVMLGPTAAASTVLLNDPDHTGTAVPVLLALLLIDQFPHRRWVPVAVAAVLGWALAGDPLVLLIGVAPLVAVCGARSFGLLALRRDPPQAAWYEVSLTAAGFAAMATASVLTRLIAAGGGFVVSHDKTPVIVAGSELPRNAAAVTEDFLRLYSGDFFGAPVNGWLLVIGVHAVFGCAAGAALVLGLRRFFQVEDLVTRLLVTAVAINLLGYALLYPGKVATTREIAPVFALGAALAGRLLGDEVTRRRLEPLLAVAAFAAVVAAACALAMVRPAPPASAGLASFLERQHLSSGLAGYWQADSTTLDSGGRLTVRSVSSAGKGLTAYRWEIDSRLFDPATNDADFFVASPPSPPAPPSLGATVTVAEAVTQFGRPYRTYRYQGYVILVWRGNLLAELGTRNTGSKSQSAEARGTKNQVTATAG